MPRRIAQRPTWIVISMVHTKDLSTEAMPVPPPCPAMHANTVFQNTHQSVTYPFFFIIAKLISGQWSLGEVIICISFSFEWAEVLFRMFKSCLLRTVLVFAHFSAIFGFWLTRVWRKNSPSRCKLYFLQFILNLLYWFFF